MQPLNNMNQTNLGSPPPMVNSIDNLPRNLNVFRSVHVPSFTHKSLKHETLHKHVQSLFLTVTESPESTKVVERLTLTFTGIVLFKKRSS